MAKEIQKNGTQHVDSLFVLRFLTIYNKRHNNKLEMLPEQKVAETNIQTNHIWAAIFKETAL